MLRAQLTAAADSLSENIAANSLKEKATTPARRLVSSNNQSQQVIGSPLFPGCPPSRTTNHGAAAVGINGMPMGGGGGGGIESNGFHSENKTHQPHHVEIWETM